MFCGPQINVKRALRPSVYRGRLWWPHILSNMILFLHSYSFQSRYFGQIHDKSHIYAGRIDTLWATFRARAACLSFLILSGFRNNITYITGFFTDLLQCSFCPGVALQTWSDLEQHIIDKHPVYNSLYYSLLSPYKATRQNAWCIRKSGRQRLKMKVDVTREKRAVHNIVKGIKPN